MGNKGRFAHFDAARQLMYAVLDQAFYSYTSAGSGGTLQQHMEHTLARYDNDISVGPFRGSFTALLGLSKPFMFDHLVHSGGLYYCYLFNRALSAHVWDTAFRHDPFGEDTGHRLRNLLRGGSVVQTLEAITTLTPNVGGFRAEELPLDAYVKQLTVQTGTQK